jgi:hypothetical protein
VSGNFTKSTCSTGFACCFVAPVDIFAARLVNPIRSYWPIDRFNVLVKMEDLCGSHGYYIKNFKPTHEDDLVFEPSDVIKIRKCMRGCVEVRELKRMQSGRDANKLSKRARLSQGCNRCVRTCTHQVQLVGYIPQVLHFFG